MMDTRTAIAAQSHRRTIDPAYFAKRRTPFVIERASISPAASVPCGTGKSANVAEADVREGNSL
jgi:hypothetical protein